MRSLPFILALVVAGPGQAARRGPEVSKWKDYHREGAISLGEWVDANPDAAFALFAWDQQKPKQTAVFVRWAVDKTSEGIEQFVAAHATWPELKKLSDEQLAGTDAFVRWCRRNPKAAQLLVTFPRGLAWTGKNLYKEQLARRTPASQPTSP